MINSRPTCKNEAFSTFHVELTTRLFHCHTSLFLVQPTQHYGTRRLEVEEGESKYFSLSCTSENELLIQLALGLYRLV